ncbi:serine protease HTRA2, mitochondrial-like isoform X2 [Anneissia japonica]|uniref:serine protease HTRA2, mitochondrial-like isoform X2 n=1 Tax=Anneissia japonica TaxID=1529436 RepID=UPI0014255B48|nr:serine protease HTRA2, mitochondrial-like isoform X2 [Anneissia japonica]
MAASIIVRSCRPLITSFGIKKVAHIFDNKLSQCIRQTCKYVPIRSITQKQMEENRRKYWLTTGKYGALIVFLIFTAPYLPAFIEAPRHWEPRREKKRKRLQQEANRLSGTTDEDVINEESDNANNKPYTGLSLPGRGVKASEIVVDSEELKSKRSNRYNFIADTVDLAGPAVVYIEIQGRHPFRRGQVPMSNGSGFIVSDDGLILTNAHVVANGQISVVKVRLKDDSVYEGRVIAVDSVSDLAALKINAGKKLPKLKLGKSSQLRPGEWVVAMGSPLSLSNTITAGIVSAVSRTSKELGLNKDIDYIQTDAAITFGNSGGPLVNLDGEAIGINTMKVTAGISFAIPIDYALDFIEESKKIVKGSQSTGWFSSNKPQAVKGSQKYYLGITMLSLTQQIIIELKQRSPDFPDIQYGVLVYGVTQGSPAHRSGLKPGDIITHIDKQEIKSSKEVYSAVKSENQLRISVVRGQKVMQLTVTPEII